MGQPALDSRADPAIRPDKAPEQHSWKRVHALILPSVHLRVKARPASRPGPALTTGGRWLASSSMRRPHNGLFLAIVVIAFTVRLGAVVLFRPAPAIDEALHLEVTEEFGAGLPTPAQLQDYGSATGPFFYIVFGNLGAVFSYDLTALRILVLLLGLGSLFLFQRILRRLLPQDGPMPAVALMATAPYFMPLAGLFMTEHLALILGLASLLCYLRYDSGGRAADALLSILFATLAVYTRVYFVFLPVCFAAAGIAQRPRFRPLWLIFLLPVLAFLPLFLAWRGLAPPTYQRMYHIGLTWQNLSSVFIWTGVCFLPWVWHRLRPAHLAALLAIPVVLLAPLPGLGFTRSVLKALPQVPALLAAVVLAVAGLAYFIWIAHCAFRQEQPFRVAAVGGLLLAAGLVISGPAVYERYLLPGYPLMLACVRPARRSWLALAWAGLFQLPAAIAHIVHLSG